MILLLISPEGNPGHKWACSTERSSGPLCLCGEKEVNGVKEVDRAGAAAVGQAPHEPAAKRGLNP